MQGYGYLGASLAAAAGRNRQNSQALGQLWQGYAPQRSQQDIQQRQFRYQKATNRMGQKDRMTNFGLTALAGLMR